MKVSYIIKGNSWRVRVISALQLHSLRTWDFVFTVDTYLGFRIIKTL